MKRRIEPFEAPRIGSRVKLINGTWFWIDDQPEPDSDKCPSCGIPYVDHSGLIGTCKRVQELSVYKSLLSCAHGALADCGLPVPGMDQDIAPVIRKLTEDRDRYKRLAGELACELGGCISLNRITKNARSVLNNYRQEGVTE